MAYPTNEWLGLSETARLLGVHPSTVRTWANRGKLPVQRTAGGHRRFRRAEVELWAAANRASEPHEVQVIVQKTISRTRLEIAEGRLRKQPWFRKLSDTQRQRFGDGSRRLMHELARYASIETENASESARVLGDEYARIGQMAGMSLREAIEAFLFFREFLMDSIFNLYETANVSSARAWGEMRRRSSRFTNMVLLAMIDAYSDRR